MNNITAYLNGSFVPLDEAKLPALDRGFLFGDSLYEVIPVYQGKPFTLNAHLDRLAQGLETTRIRSPLSHEQWRNIVQELIDRNGGGDQCLYIQISRGCDSVRNQQINPQTLPSVFAYSYAFQKPAKADMVKGLSVSTVRDIRWKHADIKTCSRLAYVLMFEEAKANGADEGIILNNGYVTEGTASNVFIVRHGVIITPPKSPLLLSGITRELILQIAEKHSLPYRETKISEYDCLKADEMWVASAVRLVRPVTEFNGTPVGKGKAGPMWETIWELYEQETTALSMPISY